MTILYLNKSRSLADIWSLTYEAPIKRAMRLRVERNLEELSRLQYESYQLDWPDDGRRRAPYAGKETDDDDA